MKKIFARVFVSTRTTSLGIAQIMLQQSAFVGLVFAAGAIFNSPALALFGILGSAFGALSATFAGFDEGDIRSGLFGFNGALVGFGLGYFYGPQWHLVIFVLLGAGLSALIVHWMLKIGFRPYTFPFVATTWSWMSLFAATGWFDIVPWSREQSDGLLIAQAVGRGFGQVLFQEKILTGILLIAAVTIANWVEGIYAIFASLLGAIIALLAGFPNDAINHGLFGYNGVLCAIALAGNTPIDFLKVFCAVTLSVLFMWCANVMEIPALTAPFVFATWIILSLDKVFNLEPPKK